jgi:hypothetical protein
MFGVRDAAIASSLPVACVMAVTRTAIGARTRSGE